MAAQVGYGDISPKTTYGKVVILGMMVVSIVLVPMQTNEVMRIMDMSSVYARSRYKLLAHRAHVVICGTLLQKQFFEELFHDDHGGSSMLDAVILQRGSPTDDVLKLIYNHKMNVECVVNSRPFAIGMRRTSPLLTRPHCT